MEWESSFGPVSLFCGGVKEFWSPPPIGYAAVVKAAVEPAKGLVRIVASTGYGTPLAFAFVRAMEEP